MNAVAREIMLLAVFWVRVHNVVERNICVGIFFGKSINDRLNSYKIVTHVHLNVTLGEGLHHKDLAVGTFASYLLQSGTVIDLDLLVGGMHLLERVAMPYVVDSDKN